MPAKNKMLNRLTSVHLVRDLTTSPGNTTLSAAVAAGATSLVLTSATNFAVGDLIRVGAGEELELAVVSSISGAPTIVVDAALTYAHAAGEAVVEQVAYDMGDVEQGGISINWNGESSDLMVATKRLVYTTLDGYQDATAEFKLPNVTPWTLAFALGIPLSKLLGAGTSASPYSVITDGNEVGTESNMSLICIGTLVDGTTVRVELWGVDMDYTSTGFKLARGADSSIPFKCYASAGGVATTNAASFTGNTTYKTTKLRVFNALTEVGTYIAQPTSPGASTVASGGAAGTNTVTLASGTNFAANDFVKFGSGDTVEYHKVHSVAGAVLTLKTYFLRAQAVGTVAAEMVEQTFASVDDSGVDVAIGGSVKKVRIGTRKRTAGLIPGAVSISGGINLQDLQLTTLAYAMGIPQSAIASARLPLGDAIASSDLDVLYVKGTNENGDTVTLVFMGCSQDLSAFVLAMSQTEGSKVPLRVKAGSAFQLVMGA